MLGGAWTMPIKVEKKRLSTPLKTTVCIFALSGCVAPSTPFTDTEPVPVQITTTQSILLEMPLPPQPVPVAVYSFEDKTGQFKPGESVHSLSRAVSQGGASILIKALRDAGNGGWFRVLERTGLENLLKERKIIREMRSRYLGEKEFNPNALPPLLFAGVILEGGIVGFDTNTLTGGVGARFLGIGGDVSYRQNAVTVNLRAVSVKTGEVLANVTTAKTIASIGIQGGAFRYVSFDELLELETGITNNEPDTLALRRTIEKSVHSLIIEGSEGGLWSFADAEAGAALVAQRNAEQFGRPDFAEQPSPRVIASASKVAMEKLAAEKAPSRPTPTTVVAGDPAVSPTQEITKKLESSPEQEATATPVAAAQRKVAPTSPPAAKQEIAIKPVIDAAASETIVRRPPSVLRSRRAPILIAEHSEETALAAPSAKGIETSQERAVTPEETTADEVAVDSDPLLKANATIAIASKTE